jgi:D-glycero-D-manno-heptose 1,7-bisphosphate phosphatase
VGIGSLNNKAVFLDRDGVINRAVVRDKKPYPPDSVQELEILPDVPEALHLLKENGFLLIVVTNQPDVGRGTQRREIVEEMHLFLKNKLPLDDIYVCWHGKDGDCDCRKPLPGMLFKAAMDWNIDLEKSFLVGDRWKDIDAGESAGCKTVFIDYSYNDLHHSTPDYKTKSISNATKWILKPQPLSV